MPPLYANSPDQLALDAIRSMSGLESMQAMLHGEIPHPPIAESLNFRLDLVERGRVVFRGAPEFGAMNPMGAVHGGWYGAILDSCLGCAVMSTLPKGSVYTTLEYKVNIIRAIALGAEVLAEARVSHSGRTTGIASGEIRGAQDGKLYATGSTTSMIFAPAAR